MNTKKCLAAWLLLVGCDGHIDVDDEDCEPGDVCEQSTDSDDIDEQTNTSTTVNRCADPGTYVDNVLTPWCDGDVWRFQVDTCGAMDGAGLINVWDMNGDNNEEHAIVSEDFDATRGWDELVGALESGVAAADYVSGLSTTFACGVDDVGTGLVYAIRVYDLDGAYADCRLLDTDPTGAGIEALLAGTAPSTNAVSSGEQIAEANCSVWN